MQILFLSLDVCNSCVAPTSSFVRNKEVLDTRRYCFFVCLFAIPAWRPRLPCTGIKKYLARPDHLTRDPVPVAMLEVDADGFSGGGRPSAPSPLMLSPLISSSISFWASSGVLAWPVCLTFVGRPMELICCTHERLMLASAKLFIISKGVHDL